MIARLKNEKVVREELEKQRTELLVKKQALIAENKKRKDDLASLDEQLKKFSTCHSHTSLAPCDRLIIVQLSLHGLFKPHSERIISGS
jgi:hypothetical protein